MVTDVAVPISALLRDVVEDTDTTNPNWLRALVGFSHRIAVTVEEVTDHKTFLRRERNHQICM